MNVVFLILIIVGCTVQSVCAKEYNKKSNDSPLLYSALVAFFSLIFFVATSDLKFNFSSSYLWYSIFFAIATSVNILSLLMAVSIGPLSVTTLISQYSLIIPTLYGLIFLGETVKKSWIWGMLFLVVSLFLTNKESEQNEKKINLKWLVYVLLKFISNGACSTIQKVYQINFDGKYQSEFMILSLSIVVVTMFIASILYEKKSFVQSLKKGFPYYSVSGLSNGMVNFLVLILSLRMSATLMFPIVSAGGVVLSVVVSILAYKEKFSLCQKIGFILGISSVVMLSV